ncbi:MAG: glycosyltransferase family 2 protein [Sarcina sp.]
MLGIIIANWNGEKLIDNCLKSFLKQKFTDFKIYIIDNGSRDKSIEIINKYKENLPINLIVNSVNTGFAKANNIGIQNALDDNCDYIMTLNNDTELLEDTLIKAITYINSNKDTFDIFQILMVNFYEKNLLDCAGIKWCDKLLPTQIGYKIPRNEIDKLEKENIMGASAGAAIYSRVCLESTKISDGEYFANEFFAYYEDVDLAIRLYQANYKTALIKNAIVYHVHSATSTKSNGFKEYYLYRNMLMYTKRNQAKKFYIKNCFTYYKIIFANIMKNLKNKIVLKSLVKAMIHGTIEAKKITYNHDVGTD